MEEKHQEYNQDYHQDHVHVHDDHHHQRRHDEHYTFHHRDDYYNHYRSDLQFSIREVLTFLIFVGSLVTAWVNLNNQQVQTNTKLELFEKYYSETLTEFKSRTEERDAELKVLISEQKKSNKDLAEHVQELERTLSQIYQRTSPKK